MKNKSAVGKHTPGPWKWEQFTDDNFGCEYALVPIDYQGDMDQILYHGSNWPITDADKALIASAPELLEACEAMMEAWENNAGLRDVISFNTAFQKAHKAIAKADGRA